MVEEEQSYIEKLKEIEGISEDERFLQKFYELITKDASIV